MGRNTPVYIYTVPRLIYFGCSQDAGTERDLCCIIKYQGMKQCRACMSFTLSWGEPSQHQPGRKCFKKALQKEMYDLFSTPHKPDWLLCDFCWPKDSPHALHWEQMRDGVQGQRSHLPARAIGSAPGGILVEFSILPADGRCCLPSSRTHVSTVATRAMSSWELDG